MVCSKRRSARDFDATLLWYLSPVFAHTDCTTDFHLQDAFTYLPHPPDRPPATPRFQYYQFVQSIDDLVIYIQQTMCPKADRLCHERAQTLSDASYVDINYDNDMYELTITAFRAGGHRGTGLWNEEIPRTNLDRLEIGILAQEHNSGAEEGEISLGGWLTVVGEDTKPSKAHLSHRPSRHHSQTRITHHLNEQPQNQLSSQFPHDINPSKGIPPTPSQPTLSLPQGSIPPSASLSPPHHYHPAPPTQRNPLAPSTPTSSFPPSSSPTATSSPTPSSSPPSI